MKRFYYLDGDKRIYITLKRASAEWCNLDCPNIYLEGDPTRWNGWRLLTGLVLEDGNEGFLHLVKSFIEKSSKAFYRKYPQCWKDRNGFLENFFYELKKYHPHLMDKLAAQTKNKQMRHILSRWNERSERQSNGGNTNEN